MVRSPAWAWNRTWELPLYPKMGRSDGRIISWVSNKKFQIPLGYTHTKKNVVHATRSRWDLYMDEKSSLAHLTVPTMSHASFCWSFSFTSCFFGKIIEKEYYIQRTSPLVFFSNLFSKSPVIILVAYLGTIQWICLFIENLSIFLNTKLGF